MAETPPSYSTLDENFNGTENDSNELHENPECDRKHVVIATSIVVILWITLIVGWCIPGPMYIKTVESLKDKHVTLGLKTNSGELRTGNEVISLEGYAINVQPFDGCRVCYEKNSKLYCYFTANVDCYKLSQNSYNMYDSY